MALYGGGVCKSAQGCSLCGILFNTSSILRNAVLGLLPLVDGCIASVQVLFWGLNGEINWFFGGAEC